MPHPGKAPADQFDRPAQRDEVAVAMVTDVHHPRAGGAVPVEDVQLTEGEVRILGPDMRHGVDVLVAGAAPRCFSRSAQRIRTNQPGS